MLNSFDTRRQCENKALAHLAFAERGIAQPLSLVMSSEGICDRALSWPGEAVLKPLHGNRSTGIEIFPSFEKALARGIQRREDLWFSSSYGQRGWRIVVDVTAE